MIVMKFGGSSVANAERIRHVAEIIQTYKDELPAVVLSAMGDTTDHLLEAADMAVNGTVDIEKVEKLHFDTARELFENCEKPLIATCRSGKDAAAKMKTAVEAGARYLDLDISAPGSVFYNTTNTLKFASMRNIFKNTLSNEKTITPHINWKSTAIPASPTGITLSGNTLSWQRSDTLYRTAVYIIPSRSSVSSSTLIPGNLQGIYYGTTCNITATTGDIIALTSVDRYGAESAPSTINWGSNSGNEPTETDAPLLIYPTKGLACKQLGTYIYWFGAFYGALQQFHTRGGTRRSPWSPYAFSQHKASRLRGFHRCKDDRRKGYRRECVS